MKEFISSTNLEFTFGSCSNCNADCCNGKKGTTYSQILKEEFENVYKNFPILFIFGDLGFVKPVVLLTNGKDFCPYQKDFKCTIYEKRPTVCRTYPLSPNLDNQIYVDTNCPEINKSKNTLIKNNQILDKSYKNEVFDNYQDKYVQTHFEFDKLDKNDFKLFLEINSISFYSYKGVETNKYLDFHLKSLKNTDIFLSLYNN